MSSSIPETVQMQAAVFLLVLVRMTGIFLIAPFYSGATIPRQLKVGLAFFLAVCTAPLAPQQGPEVLARCGSVPGIALAVLGELAIGFAIGMAGAVVLGAVQTAGSLISQDMGLTISNAIDPIGSTQTSVVGQLQVALALFIFLGLDFHHGIVRAISESFRTIPLGSLGERFAALGCGERLGAIALSQGAGLFEAALRLSLPVSAALLLVTVAMGFLSRAVPEMNVFILGFSLRLLVGLWVLILTVPLLAEAFRALFERAAREGAAALRALAGT